MELLTHILKHRECRYVDPPFFPSRLPASLLLLFTLYSQTARVPPPLSSSIPRLQFPQLEAFQFFGNGGLGWVTIW